MNAGVAICGIGGIEFVAIPNKSKVLIGANSVMVGESEVARDSEDIFNSDVTEAGKNMLYDCFAHILLMLRFGLATSLNRKPFQPPTKATWSYGTLRNPQGTAPTSALETLTRDSVALQPRATADR